MTQLDKLISWLGEHDGITQLEAFNGIGSCRLSERIRELEREGLNFSRTWETTANGAHVVRYRLAVAHG